jgi:DNA processing protein
MASSHDQGTLPYIAPRPAVSASKSTEAFVLLALAMFRGIGHTTLTAIYKSFPDLSQIWDLGIDHFMQVLAATGSTFPRHKAEQLFTERLDLHSKAHVEMERMAMRGIVFFTDRDARYPDSLRDLPKPPSWLFVHGDIELLKSPSVAVVGTRTPSIAGEQLARRCTTALLELGLTIVSGLAEGIDAIVHKTVLDHAGRTIAVLGNGINIIFPASTAAIRDQIVKEGGLLVTEYLPYEKYSRHSFVQRNRIQAALAKAVIPIQGATHSGTAHTINFALELRRPIFGVTIGTPEPIPQSELFHSIRNRGGKTFDLQHESDEFLDAIKKVIPGIERSKPLSKIDVIARQFEHLLEQYEVSSEEFGSLIDKLKAIWARHR